jgi:hypothetical protein
VLFIPRSTPAFPAAADAHGPFSLLNRALAHPLPNIPDGAPFADFVAAAEGGEEEDDDGGGGKAREEAAKAAAAATAEGKAEAAPGAAAEKAGEPVAPRDAAPPPREGEGRGRVVVASQPRGQSCAVVGGIMATRLRRLGARGLCVDGRVRDLACLSALGLPVRCPPFLLAGSSCGEG